MSSHVLYIHKGKLIIRSSQEKLEMSQSHFQIEYRVIFVIQYTHHVDHFMVLIDASTCNQTLTKLLAQLIKLRAHFPHYPIKKICLDNVGEFTSYAFNEYCI